LTDVLCSRIVIPNYQEPTMRTNSMILFAAAVLLGACTKGAERPAPAADTAKAAPVAPAPPPAGTAITPRPEVVSHIAKATPPKTAKKAKGVGDDSLRVVTARQRNQTDLVWTEPMDLTGSGTPAPTDLVVDRRDKISYAYTRQMVSCKDGTKVLAREIMAIYEEGNVFGQPAGSGWYAVLLAGGQCGMVTPTVWGERFDAKNNVFAEGMATIDPKTGDLVLAAKQ
jgi:hypothetical protein